MPLTIEARNLQRVRRDIQFCYLCGLRLPRPLDKTTSGDHVLPLSVLRHAPATNPVPLILNVHNECHIQKSAIDDVIGIWNRAMIYGPDALSSADAATLAKQFDVSPDKVSPEGMYIVKMRRPFINGAWSWVRGFHAALYESFLRTNVPHRVFSPGLEAFSPEEEIATAAISREAQSLASLKALIVQTVRLMVSADCADVIETWRNMCAFACFWTHHQRGFRCRWILSSPGDLCYGPTTGSNSLPWCGYYDTKGLPKRACVTSTAFVDGLLSNLANAVTHEQRRDILTCEWTDPDEWVSTGSL